VEWAALSQKITARAKRILAARAALTFNTDRFTVKINSNIHGKRN
jgi:hypothetical protein